MQGVGMAWFGAPSLLSFRNVPPMPVSSLHRRVRGRLTLACLLLPCVALGLSGCGNDGRNSADGSAVPVVTSIIGDTVPTGSAAGSGRPTSTTSAGGAPGSVPRGYGEAEAPIEVPATPQAVIGPDAPAVEDAARGFLNVFWAGGARTYGQLADQLAPFATEKVLAEFRQPPRSERAVAEQPVTDPSVQVTEALDATATAVGRGTTTTGTRQASVWRTLALVKDEAGAWKVDGVR
jgi:hypothetical protein